MNSILIVISLYQLMSIISSNLLNPCFDSTFVEISPHYNQRNNEDERLGEWLLQMGGWDESLEDGGVGGV